MNRTDSRIRETAVLAALVQALLSPASGGKLAASLLSGPLDWNYIKRFLDYHAMAAAAFPVLQRCRSHVPGDMLQWLENIHNATIADTAHLRREFRRVMAGLADTGVPVMPIKGMALLLDVYSGRNDRPMRDIDLICGERHLDVLEERLIRLGYVRDLRGLDETYWRRKHCHFVFTREKRGNAPASIIELHWMLGYKRSAAAVLEPGWERARMVNAEGVPVRIQSPEDIFLSLCNHYRRFGRKLWLKTDYDIAMLLAKYADRFDWARVHGEAARAGLCSAVYFALRETRFVTGLPLPVGVLEQLKVPAMKRIMIDRFIQKDYYVLPARGLEQRMPFIKKRFLQTHFLVYDRRLAPFRELLNLPLEEFAHFFDMPPYAGRTILLYRVRVLWYALTAFRMLTPKMRDSRAQHNA